MSRRIFALSGWIAAALIATVAMTSYAHSQAPFPEGAFVVGSDGARWVVGNGVRYRMSFIEGGSALGMLRDGGSVVATVGEASAALGISAGGGAGPGGAPAARTPANPAETLIGQRATTCAYNIELEVSVARVEWTKTVIGETAPGNAMWIVAFIDVTNLGTTNGGLYDQLRVRDDRGREFRWRSYPPNPVDFGRAYGVKGAYESFSPGITEQTVAAFQVPADVGPLRLEGMRDLCL